ncbi:Unsaturated glucuronyl hydrolase Ugl [Paenibacillus illinoisensis]|uniref:Unsaturated glucuronyl hydrolase Ugl n=1 Tax=Paenibacillus illinoisensis TaxID=59845 RepID=A0A2W0CTP0_9BACL|nr:Unsaturated glucuronyl hydrolase Ugl [Paenibacillus illinoisensis]
MCTHLFVDPTGKFSSKEHCTYLPIAKTKWVRSEEGLLKYGSYSVRGGDSPDDYVIWGDYFYLEALMHLEQGIPG